MLWRAQFILPSHVTPIAGLSRNLVPYSGDLSNLDCASIANWFITHIPHAHEKLLQWMGMAPLAHAYTLVISSRQHSIITSNKQFPKGGTPEDQEVFILQQAWSHQCNSLPKNQVDVDQECLLMLEEAMFEISARAGPAGHYQWGLDAGPHQNNWDSYFGRPEHWNHGDREGDESELQVR